MRLNLLGRLGMVLVLAGSSAAASASENTLIGAIKQGEAAQARTLIQQHADVNAKDLDGTTALHWAVQRDEADVVGLLLKGGASATARIVTESARFWSPAKSATSQSSISCFAPGRMRTAPRPMERRH